jgi:hypothetical protein
MVNRYWAVGLFAIVFTVTLLVGLWQRRVSQMVPTAAPVVGADMPSPPLILPRLTPSGEIPRVPDGTPSGTVPTAVRVPPVINTGAAVSASAQPLPLSITPLPWHGHPGKRWVNIINASKDPLDLNVSLTSDVSGKSFQREITLSGGGDAVLGRDDGWEITTGDILTVSSPKFNDRIVTIS